MRLDITTSEVVRRAHAMATGLTVRAHGRGSAVVERAVDDALDVFHQVDKACTRFDPASTLMRINAAPGRAHVVDDCCYEALVEAYLAYQLTDGRFDPRVLGDLVRLGYGRSMAGGVPAQVDAPHAHDARAPLPPWTAAFDHGRRELVLGPLPVDLGGIGKGLAVRWAAERLGRDVADYLVEAGGDCYCAGRSAEGGPWRVAVEDPRGGSTPVAVLELVDRAVATSSVRIRQWMAGDRIVHHLVDPRDGRSGGQGLLSVTVVAVDPAWAEVRSKVLFLEGAVGVEEVAERDDIPALWVRTDGRIATSAAMRQYEIWRSA